MVAEAAAAVKWPIPRRPIGATARDGLADTLPVPDCAAELAAPS
jgi:hypothetical protein